MVLYNPKEWWKIIFAFHKSEVFRMMTPGIIGVFLYTGIIAFLENEVFHATFKNTTAIHSLVGFVLSLLLVFRTNTAYDRWWEGRRLWGNINNDSRNLFLKLNSILEFSEDKDTFRILISNFPFAVKHHLQSKSTFDEILAVKNYDTSADEAGSNVPLKIMNYIYLEIEKLRKDKKISELQVLYIKDECRSLVDSLGACERIKNTPIPFSYNMFIKKVIFLYVFTMPIGFVREFGYWAMPIVASLFYVFSSIELIAEEIEDPFGEDQNDLPLEEICQNIRKQLTAIQSTDLNSNDAYE
jgi:ion channel-forming bestrophin family protein